MEKIFSKVDPKKLLHFVVRRDDFLPGRQDLIEPDNFLQCSMLCLTEKGQTFKAHYHIYHEADSNMSIANESWCVVKGVIKCIFYDIDKTIISEKVLYAGDASFTIGGGGGHNYVCMEPFSLIYEYKSGPYFGQEKDKVFI